MSTTRRVFFYLVTIITLGILAAGVGQLLSLVFDLTIKSPFVPQVGRVAFIQQQLSLGLAMLVIGGPLWFLFWRAVQRNVVGNQAEIGATIRKFFLNLIVTVSALIALVTASDFLRWLISGVPLGQLPSSALGAMLVTGAIWYYHWHISETEGQPSPAAKTLRRWYIYILSGFGLVWLAVGPVLLVNVAVLNLPLWQGTLVYGQFWNAPSQMGASQLVLGGAAWVFHWFRMARGDFESTLRQVYLYLLTILGSSIAGLVALTTSLYMVFVWAFGGATSANHFQFLGWTIPTTLVTAAIWSYHQRVAVEEEGQLLEPQLSAQRVHVYLMSFVGLGALITGLIVLFGTLLNLIINATTPPAAVAPGWWRGQLSLCLALLIVATPLWLYYWNRALQRATAGGITEWRARARRIFLYGFVAAAIITLAADLVNIVYQLLNGILQGTLGAYLVNSRWSWQSLVVAVPVLLYHWRIVRQDRSRGAEAVAVRKTVTLLVSERARDLVSRLEEKLGYRVRVLLRVEPTPADIPALSDEEVSKLASEIQAAPSAHVVVVVGVGKVEVVPYEEG